MHTFYVIRVLALIDNHIRQQQQQNEQYLLYIIHNSNTKTVTCFDPLRVIFRHCTSVICVTQILFKYIRLKLGLNVAR